MNAGTWNWFRALSCNIKRCCSVSLGNEVLTNPHHNPVMTREVNEYLNIKNGDTILDMTFGAGGHSRKLLQIHPDLKIIALDRDPLAYEFAQNLEKEVPGQVTPLLGKFSELPHLLSGHGIPFESFDGIICDLGASSMQMDLPERGFALSKCGPLDMRMDAGHDPNQITAADIVNFASESELYKIFKIYGEEKCSRIIASSIVQARYSYKFFKTTTDLANLIELILRAPRLDKLGRRVHPGTKVFQALRIFVNNEINELNHGLKIANLYLKSGCRLVVLTFHSLEDVIVKRHFQGHIEDNTSIQVDPKLRSRIAITDEEWKHFSEKPWYPVNKKVVVPTHEEISENPRSRSAKLRAAVKINTVLT